MQINKTYITLIACALINTNALGKTNAIKHDNRSSTKIIQTYRFDELLDDGLSTTQTLHDVDNGMLFWFYTQEFIYVLHLVLHRVIHIVYRITKCSLDVPAERGLHNSSC